MFYTFVIVRYISPQGINQQAYGFPSGPRTTPLAKGVDVVSSSGLVGIAILGMSDEDKGGLGKSC
jgi:hypothetical protein